jgi:phenylpyruvate tautomerase PptA (4-oxalocrotonate tautomerase family)
MSLKRTLRLPATYDHRSCVVDVPRQSNAKSPAGGLDRRTVLASATAVVGGLSAVSTSALADTPPSGNFGAPLVELCVPAGVLTLEQRSDLIKGITDVVLGAIKPPPDPARRLFVEIVETAEGGYGVNGQVFVPRKR